MIKFNLILGEPVRFCTNIKFQILLLYVIAISIETNQLKKSKAKKCKQLIKSKCIVYKISLKTSKDILLY